MTVAQLITLLKKQNPKAEVRLALQPSYPVENHISHVVARHRPSEHDALNAPAAVLIVTGGWYGYGESASHRSDR